MEPPKKQTPLLVAILPILTVVLLFINPFLGIVSALAIAIFFQKGRGPLGKNFPNYSQTFFRLREALARAKNAANVGNLDAEKVAENTGLEAQLASLIAPSAPNTALLTTMPATLASLLPSPAKRLERRKKYLHIALNSTLEDAEEIISQLPASDRILIEVGTPLIKIYGTNAILRIKGMAPFGTYIVADNKCADLATREVKMMADAGANAATCLGVAPIETIDSFIEECEKFNIDSMVDMMNVGNSLELLKKLKKLPNVVILHRGVDESEISKEKQIPYYQIKQIKGNYNILVAVAGGDTINEVQKAIFNDADIVVVWKNFYQSNAETAQLAQSFLNEI